MGLRAFPAVNGWARGKKGKLRAQPVPLHAGRVGYGKSRAPRGTRLFLLAFRNSQPARLAGWREDRYSVGIASERQLVQVVPTVEGTRRRGCVRIEVQHCAQKANIRR